ncbi:hypothetical protein PFLUV_G00051100 [Perca fluviatilis]|uniref:Uncharacterized protein n=1 Tax=Perca fluviatilis TaxID=8168 RepID=A0A6A5FAQ1_PERFL|nr:hypothetical protein PFLUV_G00051100 [Perca fluviatilis]
MATELHLSPLLLLLGGNHRQYINERAVEWFVDKTESLLDLLCLTGKTLCDENGDIASDGASSSSVSLPPDSLWSHVCSTKR